MNHKWIPVLLTVFFMVALPPTAFSHEGAHEKSESHKEKSTHSNFKEGSGSSVLKESDHSRGSDHQEMGSEYKEEGSGSRKMNDQKEESSDHREEGSGTAPKTRDH